jgi:hypothetical protein
MCDHFDDTVDCPRCGSENAYFNGVAYECPECDFEWDDETDAADDYFDYLDEKEKEFDRQGRLFVGEKISVKTLKNLFSPDWQFYKRYELFKETGVEEDFYNELLETLAETNRYDALLAVKAPSIAPERKDSLIRGAVCEYLESRDELPLFPTVQDWSAAIQAPEDFIRKIIPGNGVNFRQFLPLASDPRDLTILFYRKLQTFYDELQESNPELADEISPRGLERLFTALSNGEKPERDDVLWLIVDKVNASFADELALIKRYREALHKKGAFATSIREAKAGNLSLIDTIILILKDYLKDILDEG